MALVSGNMLRGYEGRSIRDICPHGFDDPEKNHCAHFVAHLLQLNFGATCASLRGRRGATGGANVRVHEIFANCPGTRQVVECPTHGSGLVFVSHHTNFVGSPTRMQNVKKKHIGVVLNGIVWHYSNIRNRVVQQPVGQFLFHYSGQTNAIWWGQFPRTSKPTYLGTSGL